MMAEMGFDGIEVSCGIMEDGNPMARGNLPLDVFVAEFLHFFKQIMLMLDLGQGKASFFPG